MYCEFWPYVLWPLNFLIQKRIVLQKLMRKYGMCYAWKPKLFFGKTTKSISPWTRDSLCQNSAVFQLKQSCVISQHWVENTPKCPKLYYTNLPALAQNLGYHRKASSGVHRGESGIKSRRNASYRVYHVEILMSTAWYS